MDARIRRRGGPWLLAASLTVAAACASRSGPRGGVDDPCGRVRTPPVEEVAQLQLHDAARTGDAGQIECLIAAGADVNAFDLNRMTPLYVAAVHGQVEAINALVDAGAGVDAGENLWGFAPLHAAIANGQVGAMNALIEAGADVNALANPFGTSPLHLALGGAFFNVLFLDPDDGHERHAPVSVVRALLAAGADPNAVEYDANLTPLQLALIGQDGGGNIEYVRALLSAGADPNKRTLVHGDPGPDDSMGAGVPSVVEILLAAGANPMARGIAVGATPLHLAAGASRLPAVIAALVAAGADHMAREAGGNTPLHRAAAANANPGVIDALLAAGADPSATNDGGVTPWDRLQQNEALRGSDAYWRMNDARFGR